MFDMTELNLKPKSNIIKSRFCSVRYRTNFIKVLSMFSTTVFGANNLDNFKLKSDRNQVPHILFKI